MHNTQKLYIVTRRDLTPGMQAAQSVHAAFEFARTHPLITEWWMEQSNNICVLAVADLRELEILLGVSKVLNLDSIGFYEPDVNNELTAIAIEPCDVSQRLVSGLELALKQ